MSAASYEIAWSLIGRIRWAATDCSSFADRLSSYKCQLNSDEFQDVLSSLRDEVIDLEVLLDKLDQLLKENG